MLDRKAFNFYKSFYDVALLLPEKDKIEFIMAICHSQFTGEIVEPKSDLAKLAFTSQLHSIKKQLDGYQNGKNTPYKNTLKAPLKAPLTQVQVEEKEEEKGKEEGEAYRKFKHLTLSVSEFDKLVSNNYTKEQIDLVLDKIENYKNNKKYVSLYLTCLNWLKLDYPKKEIKNTKGSINDNNF